MRMNNYLVTVRFGVVLGLLALLTRFTVLTGVVGTGFCGELYFFGGTILLGDRNNLVVVSGCVLKTI